MSDAFLIVEDDPEYSKLLSAAIQAMGRESEKAVHGRDGLERALSGNYALVILDINLPGLSGIEICRELRRQKPLVPILMLTGRTDEIDKVLALELGADDYVTKPFSVRELQARIAAILRRSERQDPIELEVQEIIVRGGLTINVRRHEVTLDGNEIRLSAMEWELLVLLASHPGRVFTRQQLMNTLWGYVAESCETVVTAHLSRLRSKLETNPDKPKFILTVRGFGYRFAEDL